MIGLPMHKSIEKTIQDIAKSLKAGINPVVLWGLLLADGWQAHRVSVMIRWANQHNKVAMIKTNLFKNLKKK